MTMIKVTYTEKNFGAYFAGSNDYFETKTKFFTTEEKADEFIANAMMVYVPTWGKEAVAKAEGNGRKEVVEVE